LISYNFPLLQNPPSSWICSHGTSGVSKDVASNACYRKGSWKNNQTFPFYKKQNV
jgi:hypothetical protein